MDNTEWRVSPDIGEEELNNVLNIKSALESINEDDIDMDRRKKKNTAYAIFTVLVYLSLISSIWLFLFGITTWYGMPIFGLIALLVSDFRGYDR